MGFFQPHGRGRQLFRRDALKPTKPATGTAGVPPAGGPEARGPIVVIHTLAHAVATLNAAAEAGTPIVLLSAANAGIYAGPGWWRELIAAARGRVPAAESTAILDCGDDAGAAQAAIRAGVDAIVFKGRADVALRVADIARQRGVRFAAERPEVTLDLGTFFFAPPETLERRCAEIGLARPANFANIPPSTRLSHRSDDDGE